jgi:SAM-dependent methyltransferase
MKTPNNPSEALTLAEKFLLENRDNEALPVYESIARFPGYEGISWFRRGEIFNRTGDVQASIDHHRQAFKVEPSLAGKILPKDLRHHSYIYAPSPQIKVKDCPLCGSKGEDYACYNLLTSANFLEGFDPVRIWVKCLSCHHLFARNYPRELNAILSSSTSAVIQKPILDRLVPLSRILKALMSRTSGRKTLEIGVGAGEMVAVAKEMGLEISGIDIREDYAKQVSKTVGIEVICQGFLEFESSDLFDILLLGDVLEHVTEPLAALKKSMSLLEPGGILWISTPNFESAHTRILEFQDPMWRVCEHLQYFSFRSFEGSAEKLGFEIIDYDLSGTFPGSMELTLRRA